MNTFLDRLDDLHASLAAMLGLCNEVKPSSVPRALYGALGPSAVFIGEVCASAHGFVHAPTALDLAANMTADETLTRLREAGLDADMELTNALPWVVCGETGGVIFKVVPADHMGVDPARGQVVDGIRVASVEDYITSRCAMGGRADIHDAAVLVLIRPELRPYAEAQAATHPPMCCCYETGWSLPSKPINRGVLK